MALILHIETATPTCSVALSEKGMLLSLKEETAQNIHASVITLFIESVMREAGKKLDELEAVCVSKGPGSYTGLRIGVSSAKGLCYALDKPLIAINTLEAMASGLLNRRETPGNPLLCPMLDARRMEVFMAVYRALAAGNTLLEVEAPRAQVMQADSLEPLLEKGPLLLFGTGAEKCRTLFQSRTDVEIITDFRQSAADMVLPAEQKFKEKQFEDIAYFEPLYLKEFISASALQGKRT